MKIPNKAKNFFSNNWVVSCVLLLMYFLTHSYRYGWDDQALEIPLLKSLIDPALYGNDYYVQSLKVNFTTYFYPVLAKIINISQIPATYLFLFVVSRFFLFYWIYRLWLLISESKFKAFLCSLTLIVLFRVQDFLYISFSHQEFVLPFIFAGMYYFYKNRFVLTSCILGFAANVHAIYSLFAFMYLFVYMLISIKKYGVRHLLKVFVFYSFFASPFIIWNITKRMGAIPLLPENWVELYRMATPESFLFGELELKRDFGNILNLLSVFGRYLFFVAVYIFNSLCNSRFNKNIKNHVIVLVGFFMLFICFFLGDVLHNKFILMLNLSRHKHFLDFLLGGFVVLTALDMAEKKNTFLVLLSGYILLTLYLKNVFVTSFMIVFVFFYLFWDRFTNKESKFRISLMTVSLVGCVGAVICFIKSIAFLKYDLFAASKYNFAFIGMVVVFLFSLIPIPLIKRHKIFLNRVILIIPFLLFVSNYAMYRFKREGQETKFDMIQQQWVDMQNYVRDNTAKDAMILVPYDFPTGGFRICSERGVVVSERDKGIVSFDMAALLEWQKRKTDLKGFVLNSKESVMPYIKDAVTKYGANYIVFTHNQAPKPNNILGLVYYNKLFSLYEVRK